MFYRRDPDPKHDPYLFWKLGLFFVAAGVWILGLAAEREWVTGVAIGILALALLLRFLPDREA